MREPGVRNSCIKNGLEDGFCKNYINLYKITKKLGEDQSKENEM
jgi:hypothetical protein